MRNAANLSPRQRQIRQTQEAKRIRKRHWHPVLKMAEELIHYASVSDRNPEVRKKKRKQIAQRFWLAFKSWLLKKY